MGEPALAFAAPGAQQLGPKALARRTLSDATIRRALERLPDLSALEEQLLFRVCCLSLQHGFAWISQAHLASLLRCSERTVRDATKSVCERELLVTVRTREGLRYLPQWEELGLDGAVPQDQPAKSAGPDRQNLPVLLRSTKRSDNTNSSSTRARATPPAAVARSIESLEEPHVHERAPISARRSSAPPSTAPLATPQQPELGAVLDRFGPAAERDVREVLQSPLARGNPAAQQAALERLLSMSPDSIRTSPGACFRVFVRLALEGRLQAERSDESPPPAAATADPEPELPAEELAALRARKAELYEQLERVHLDGEKAAPLRVELAQINRKLPPRQRRTLREDVPYQARDGNTAQNHVDALRKLLHAPTRLVAIAALQLLPTEALELVLAHASSHPSFAAVVATQLDAPSAQRLACELAPDQIQVLLAALHEHDPVQAARLRPDLLPN